MVGDSLVQIAKQFVIAQTAAPTLARLNIGDLITSATNLTLAIEVYLKALLFQNQIPVEPIHDLHKLFVTLPSNQTAQITTEYKKLAAGLSKTAVGGFAIEMIKVGNPAPKHQKRFFSDTGILALLRRNADAFVIWRYIFSNGEKVGVNAYKYEFTRF